MGRLYVCVYCAIGLFCIFYVPSLYIVDLRISLICVVRQLSLQPKCFIVLNAHCACFYVVVVVVIIARTPKM